MTDAPLGDPPIVLVGGAGEDADLWAEVCALLDEGARVHDLPGHGARRGPPLRSVEEMADDVVAACDGPGILVGHSLGGAVVLSAALRAPQAVAGVVVVSAGARLPVGPALLEMLPDSFDAALPLVLSASTGGRGGRVPDGSQEVAARMERMLRRGGAELFNSGLEACAAFDVTAELDGAVPPMIVLVGEGDRMTPPALGCELAEGVGGELHVLPGCGHQVPWEDPAALAAAAQRLRRRCRP